jgi:aldose sugar dehydrogenase
VGGGAWPRGGDELNLIEPGKNYGWPLVSYAVNCNGVPIPSPDSRLDLAKPVLYWTPIIAPGNLIFYDGKMFPQWKGSALVSGLASKALIRIVVTGATAKGVERWNVGHRIRDVEVGAGRRALDARRQQFRGAVSRNAEIGSNTTRR